MLIDPFKKNPKIIILKNLSFHEIKPSHSFEYPLQYTTTMRFIKNIFVQTKLCREKFKIEKLTDGLFGNPTRWPHVVSKFTKHSRTRPCDIHGRFHPLNVAASAGDKLALRLGEFGVPWLK